MANTKLIVFLCFAALANCGQARNPHFNEAELNDIFDTVKVLLDNLGNVVSAAAAEAVKTVNSLLDQLNEAEESLLDILPKELDDLVTGLVNEINEVVKDATKKGLNTTACVGTSLTDLAALPVTALQNATDCAVAKVQNAQKACNATLLLIQSVVDDVKKIGNEIDACHRQSIFVQPICVSEITAEITKDVVSLPLKITNDVASVTVTVTKSIAGIAECKAQAISDITLGGGKIVKDVTDCILKL